MYYEREHDTKETAMSHARAYAKRFDTMMGVTVIRGQWVAIPIPANKHERSEVEARCIPVESPRITAERHQREGYAPEPDWV